MRPNRHLLWNGTSIVLLLSSCSPQPSPAGAPSTAQSPAASLLAQDIPTAGGEYFLRSACSGKVAEAANSGTATYTKVRQATQNRTSTNGNQRWKLVTTTAPYFSVMPQHASNLFMEVNGASSTDGASVQLWTTGTGSNQQWQFVAGTGPYDGYYKIVPRHNSALRLHLPNDSLSENVNLDISHETGTCNQYWKLEATNPVYTAPIIIKNASDTTGAPASKTVNGVRYFTGNWQSTSNSTPAVKITTSEPIVIENCNVVSKGDLFTTGGSGVTINATIRNCYGRGELPSTTVAGLRWGFLFKGDNVNALTIENNYFDRTAGIDLMSSTGKQPNLISIRYNYVKNTESRATNGTGGLTNANYVGDPHRHFVQLNTLQLASTATGQGIEIGWNQVVNEPGNSRVEDNINVYSTKGLPALPINIHDNLIDGAFGYALNTPDGSDYSGGGILTGDGSSCGTQYVLAENNVILETSNYGIAVASGGDVTIRNNRVFGVGMASGQRWDTNPDSGIYQRSACTGVSVTGNTVGWTMYSTATAFRRNDFPTTLNATNTHYDTDTSTPTTYEPANIPTSLTASERNNWVARTVSSGVVVGIK